ncbi:MAG: Uma2 family endonuclease [Bacteroidota bacterium]
MGVTKKFQQPPRTGMEVFMMLPEGTLAELINDRIYMSPAPNYSHQDLSGELYTQLRTFIKKNNLGNCISAPVDVFFDDRNVLQPDILFIATENMGIIKGGKVKGCPDMIIEILSPGNKDHDKVIKKAAYEKFGVKEYFIVDPENKETITWYLTGKKYAKQVSVKGKIKSKLLKKIFSF